MTSRELSSAFQQKTLFSNPIAWTPITWKIFVDGTVVSRHDSVELLGFIYVELFHFECEILNVPSYTRLGDLSI